MKCLKYCPSIHVEYVLVEGRRQTGSGKTFTMQGMDVQSFDAESAGSPVRPLTFRRAIGIRQCLKANPTYPGQFLAVFRVGLYAKSWGPSISRHPPLGRLVIDASTSQWQPESHRCSQVEGISLVSSQRSAENSSTTSRTLGDGGALSCSGVQVSIMGGTPKAVVPKSHQTLAPLKVFALILNLVRKLQNGKTPSNPWISNLWTNLF